MVNVSETANRLREHVAYLTETIGERSIFFPENLTKAKGYILQSFHDSNIVAHMQSYDFRGMGVANVIARLEFSESPSRHYVVGAHYDSVEGSVGADDNASAVAVLLETGRQLKMLQATTKLDLAVTLVNFALEEPPVFMTPQMGSMIYAADAKRKGEKIDGMICLEMVGYTCHEPGCQDYPFPLTLMNYPKEGDFIGVVGNFASRPLTRALVQVFEKNANLPVVHLTVPFNGWLMPAVRLSDHAPFWDHGYHAVMITDSAFYRNPYYHTPEDTMDKLDFPFMAELVRSLITFFASLRR